MPYRVITALLATTLLLPLGAELDAQPLAQRKGGLDLPRRQGGDLAPG
ncbi:MAG: hypothetical protein ACI9K5_003563, partial [Gammaproteobacteria bacterium]